MMLMASESSRTTVLQSYQADGPRHFEEDGALNPPSHHLSYDFTKLSQSIYHLQAAFSSIATGLALYESRTATRPRWDLKFIHRAAAKPAKPLTARWDGLRKTWDKLLVDSKSHAFTAYAVLKQNGQVFRGFGTQRDMETCEALATEVRNLMEVIKDNQTRSDAIRARFSTFRDDVSLFKVELERTLQGAASKSKEAFSQCAEAALTNFTALGENLKRFDEEMKATDTAFSACFAQCLLLKRFPDMKAKGIQAEAEAAKRDKAFKKLEQEHVRLTELESSLRVMVSVLDNFAKNANTVGDAWELISHQFCELDAQLEVAVTGTVTSVKSCNRVSMNLSSRYSHWLQFFGAKLDSTFEAYEGLKDILYGYASALGGRNLPR
ncbi:hypothetical protein FKP32DRAFT_1686792 [Trametes sanguinea]|nr:hypothetical protein FKP32DRAFT_1686792 [Trametes sanguinea]